METIIIDPKPTLKNRLIATAKKVKPYAIGAGIGLGAAALVVTAKSMQLTEAFRTRIEDGSIEITELEDGGFSVTETISIEDTPED